MALAQLTGDVVIVSWVRGREVVDVAHLAPVAARRQKAVAQSA